MVWQGQTWRGGVVGAECGVEGARCLPFWRLDARAKTHKEGPKEYQSKDRTDDLSKDELDTRCKLLSILLHALGDALQIAQIGLLPRLSVSFH